MTVPYTGTAVRNTVRICLRDTRTPYRTTSFSTSYGTVTVYGTAVTAVYGDALGKKGPAR
jgi:hypothetical protein